LVSLKTKEGLLMAGLTHSSNSGSDSFQRIADVFLARSGLPFAEVLSAERIERIFAKHGNLFGVEQSIRRP